MFIEDFKQTYIKDGYILPNDVEILEQRFPSPGMSRIDLSRLNLVNIDNLPLTIRASFLLLEDNYIVDVSVLERVNFIETDGKPSNICELSIMNNKVKDLGKLCSKFSSINANANNIQKLPEDLSGICKSLQLCSNKILKIPNISDNIKDIDFKGNYNLYDIELSLETLKRSNLNIDIFNTRLWTDLEQVKGESVKEKLYNYYLLKNIQLL